MFLLVPLSVNIIPISLVPLSVNMIPISLVPLSVNIIPISLVPVSVNIIVAMETIQTWHLLVVYLYYAMKYLFTCRLPVLCNEILIHL